MSSEPASGWARIEVLRHTARFVGDIRSVCLQHVPVNAEDTGRLVRLKLLAGEGGGSELATSPPSVASPRLMWAVQWPSSETEAAADATLATGASGPGSLFLPPAQEAAAEAEEAAAAEEDRLAAEAEAELARLAVLCRAASHRTARAERAAQVWAGMLQERRRAMVSELGGLYPILERDAQSRIFSIRGLLLAEGDGSRQEEENTSTALGYVAHSTLMLAMCLGVRLRYEVLFVASRSYVRDSMDPFSPPRLFPLFSKGRTTDDFRVGLRMLRRNVEQLLLSQGCPVPERAPLLANLRVLLHSMLLASREEEGGSAESAAGREGAAGTTASMGGGSAAGGAMAW
ncbi:hypothetical protein FNF27_06109 [Cafeteria roenbergensis]|uniref:Uncharacterized protein n=1 Tax=Cafeteria roenbergensis TaxID=33653 RepID=A0A5A8E8K2_CAFRO|nr:hypothetical protein FNF29_07041 [Cafeteria roenbergensis]KAA0148058.1 hypothetical protein FNF28_07493 [Cafeteria roenbergensis]KAA0172310.1 hypothetical protein FNF27_06109 [Cafeteria roenbergensis]|eukprot:KAA0147952.1 hypothetical protein FNF29_07041 [Cafeteria roenbergensis]